MVSFADLQNAYNAVYAEIRKYIWDFETVYDLADLEVAVYKTCQDLDDIRLKFYRLKRSISEALQEDEALTQKVDYFESLLEEDSVYVKLNMVNEVIQQ